LLPAFRDDVVRVATQPFRVLDLPNMLQLLVERRFVQNIAVGRHAVRVGIGLTPQKVYAGVEPGLSDRVCGLPAFWDFWNALWYLAPSAS